MLRETVSTRNTLKESLDIHGMLTMQLIIESDATFNHHILYFRSAFFADLSAASAKGDATRTNVT